MVIEDLIKKILKEATTDGGGRGSYLAPLRPGLRKFEKTQLDPFNINVSNYDSPFLAYDSYDGKMNTPKKQIKKIETKAVKFSEYAKKHPVGNDDDGDNINPFPSKIGEWIEVTDNTLTEDLAVWFGEKKKPKGSSQPKGPWVDICRKVNGKHPPCGRSDASEGSYPKCRAAGVAGKMSDSEKRNACQQKRKAEKNDPQSGKGQKPVMVSHKKKTNENMKQKIIILTENDITRIVRRVLKEDTNKTEGIGRLDLKCVNYLNGSKKEYLDYTFFSENKVGEFSIKKIKNSAIPDDGIQERTSELLYLTMSQPNQKIIEFINSRFPNFYWDEALKYVIYLSTTATPQHFCKAMQEGVDPGGHTSEEWITFFENSSVAYNLPDSIF